MGAGPVEINRFRGKSDHTLDAKGRLNFPSRYKEILQQDGSGVLMLTTIDNKCIRVYTMHEWKAFEDKLLANKSKPGAASLIRRVSSNSFECGLDKQGRILLPAHLRQVVHVEKEVVLNGMFEFAEIWAKDAWEYEERRAEEEFPDIEDALASMDIL